jgi:hypothetical protein
MNIKVLAFFIVLLCSANCIGQMQVVGRVVSIITGKPIGNSKLQLNRKQMVHADSNGVFSFETTKKKVRVTVFADAGQESDTVLVIESVSDTISVFGWDPIGSSMANYDLNKGEVQLFAGGGFLVKAISREDKIFQSTYSVKYHLLGCVLPDQKGISQYNQAVAEYLDAKFGTEWRQSVRNDISGLPRKDGK